MEEILDSALPRKRSIGVRKVETSQEAAWVKASQQGDVIAFNRLVLIWEKSIYNLALRMLQDPDEAAESTQEVFLNAFKNIRRFRLEAQFSTWLYRIAAIPTAAASPATLQRMAKQGIASLTVQVGRPEPGSTPIMEKAR